MSLAINPALPFDRFISKKPVSTYPKSIINEIKLISASVEGNPSVTTDTTPFGSLVYRLQKYPGDIDVIENFTACCSVEDVVNKFALAFQKVVKRIKSSKLHYYSESKIGLDRRYEIEIGHLINGKYQPDPNLKKNVYALYEHELLPENEVIDIDKVLSKSNLNSDDYDIIHSIIRNHYVIRWKSEDILRGYIILTGGKKMTLKEALHIDAVIKIDEITLVNGRFIEVTNIFFLAYVSPNGTIVHINEQTNPNRDLPIEIEKLYFSNMWYSPFKMVKRMFSLARSRYNAKIDPELYKDVLVKLFPLITGNSSLLYQIKSELDTIVVILERIRNPPMRTIHKQIDEMKLRLSTALEIPEKRLSELNMLIDIITSTNDAIVIIESIEKINKYLKKRINFDTIVYLDNVGLNPLPNFMLPEDHKYNRNILRLPDDNPINPMSLLTKGGCLTCGGEEIDINAEKRAREMYSRSIDNIYNDLKYLV